MAPQEWMAGLTRAEQRALREHIEEILLQFQGGRQEQVRRLARELGLEDQAYREFETGKRHERLRALYWFWLLESPVDPDRLIKLSKGDKDTEAAAARVLLDSHGEAVTECGTDLLLGRGQSLSVIGMDVLYEMYKIDPTALFEYAASEAADWSESLLIQVFEVIAHTQPAGSDTSLDWVIEHTRDASADVRVAAFSALADYGWREDVRTQIDWEHAATDRNPAVRNAVYTLLGRWGEWANSIALAALEEDLDARAKVTGIAALFESIDPDQLTERPALHEAFHWVEQTNAIG